MEKTYESESMWLIETRFASFVKVVDVAGFCNEWGQGKPLVYVDLGCSHPTNRSLTSFCRDLGWRGVAIDGNPDYGKDWEAVGFKDHFFCGILSDKPFARFAIHENSFTSRISESTETDHPEKWGINRIVEHYAVPLNQILAIRGIDHIDLLTIDLEGAEFDVLQTLDFEKHSPSFIIAEYDTAGVGIDCRVCNFLLGKGYEVIQQFPSNLIYRRK